MEFTIKKLFGWEICCCISIIGCVNLLVFQYISPPIHDTQFEYLNTVVYTTTPVAGGWTGAVMSWAVAVMSWAEALTSMKYSYLNFSTFKKLKPKKKVKCDKQSATDRPTNMVTYMLQHTRQK